MLKIQNIYALFSMFLLLQINCKQYSQLNEHELILRYEKQTGLIADSLLLHKKGYDYLKELCELGHRLSGSENSIKAIKWAEAKMKKLGFDNVLLQPVMVPRWVRGKIEKAIIVNSKQYNGRKLSVSALGGSIGTDKQGMTAKVIEVNSTQELKTLGDKVKGKIVFVNKVFNEKNYDTFKSYGEIASERYKGPLECSKYGAVAMILRSATSKYDNVPHTGVTAPFDSLKAIPSASIGLKDADYLSKALRQDPNLKINLNLSCKNEGEVQSYNVIGEIKGSELPEEVIVIGGHFDSWDVSCGAHDDGAGCIQSMEVLDIFKRLNISPKRTIRCVFFINEENGTRGGTEYGNYAKTAGEKHIVAIESDRGISLPRGFYVDSDSTTLNKIKTWLPLLENTGIDWIKKGGSGVDISKIDNCKIRIGFVPDWQHYFDYHHSANDELESVSPRELELGTAAIAILTLLLSEEGI
jgi:Zn-dependent M28 family amino/carboxypeptidase